MTILKRRYYASALTVCTFDVILRRIAVYAKDLVIIHFKASESNSPYVMAYCNGIIFSMNVISYASSFAFYLGWLALFPRFQGSNWTVKSRSGAISDCCRT